MGKGKRRWWKKFSGFMKPKKKKMEQLKRMDEIQRLAESDKASEFIFTDSDGNVIVPDGNETLEFMHAISSAFTSAYMSISSMRRILIKSILKLV